MNTKLRIAENDIRMTVGHFSKNQQTQEVIYHIPAYQQFDEANHVRINGLQHYGFSKFLILLEWTNPSYGAKHFLVDSNDYKEGRDSLTLHPLKGGNLKFNEMAKTAIISEELPY